MSELPMGWVEAKFTDFFDGGGTETQKPGFSQSFCILTKISLEGFWVQSDRPYVRMEKSQDTSRSLMAIAELDRITINPAVPWTTNNPGNAAHGRICLEATAPTTDEPRSR